MIYTVEAYTGKSVGAYHARYGVQIVATDETGKRRYVFEDYVYGGYRKYKTPCLKLWEGVAHYKSGLNKEQSAVFVEKMEEAKKLAAKWNAAGTHEEE